MITFSGIHGLFAQVGIQDLLTPDARTVILSTFAISAGIFAAIYVFIFVILRLWFRRINSDAGLVAIRVSQIPAFVVGIATVLKLTLVQAQTFLAPLGVSQVDVIAETEDAPEAAEVATAPSSGIVTFIDVFQHILTAVIALFVTYWVSRLLTEVVLYYLKKYAEKTEAQWDDVLIPILDTTLPLITYLIGGLIALQAIGIDLSGIWVAVGGVTFVLGFALRGILSDFFGGLVLLIDTPFRFGDVVVLADGTRAVIKKVGLRVTNLYVIDKHSELYVPNGILQNQEIVNLSRPTTDYYYTIELTVKFDADPAQVFRLMEAVVLAHPDTLGNIQQKLELIDTYYGVAVTGEQEQKKREIGRLRLAAEVELNKHLAKVEETFDQLSSTISEMEGGGLDPDELKTLQTLYKDLCNLIGLEPVTTQPGKFTKTTTMAIMADSPDPMNNGNGTHLIALVRKWYHCWLQDPDLSLDDQKVLPREWEQKIDLLSQKATRLFRMFNVSSRDETRLDDAVDAFYQWLQESFKTTRNEWQQPRVWMSSSALDGATQGANKNFKVKFYVDDITLEHFQRGYRVESEVNRELNWHLRQAYLAR